MNLQFTKKKTGFHLRKDGKTISFEMNDVKFPFGIEEYKKKLLVNIEFYKKNNQTLSNINTIKQFEDNFKTLEGIPKKIKDELDNKLFKNSLKDEKSPKLRCHFKNKGSKILDDEGDPFYDPINQRVGKIKLILDSIWIHNDTYGLLWIIEEIIIKEQGMNRWKHLHH